MPFDSPEEPFMVHEFFETVGGSEELAKSEEMLKEFEDIYQEYKHSIYILLVRLVGDDETAQDLAQETFLHAWVSFNKLRSKAAVKAWLNTIATNQAKDYFRRIRVKRNKITRWLPWNEKLEDTERLSVSDPGEQVSEAEHVQHILNQLLFRERACLVLYYSGGYHQKEIAQILKISEREVRRRLVSARAKFLRMYHK